ncbi:MAG: bifunctional riboflavin kinase/FAD synthetase [Lachnospiraceae bacterium]|nr:bifunctional riboflavin kinase/FAD synthetase [Lachnospiraceae bacterium]
MKIISNTTEFYLGGETAVAIGKFDGVHLGHRRLLWEINEQKKRGLMTCVFTFDPTPAVLFGMSDGKEITTKEEKRSIFEKLGVDILIEFPLTKETAAIQPESFVKDILVKQMHTKFVAAGTDLSFGNKGAGNAALLTKLGQELKFQVKTIDKISVDGIEVSSTYIRKLIENGEMEQTVKMLGMPYLIKGKVVHGNRIGRTLGFPTVNLLPGAEKLLPPNGVYRSEVLVGTRMYQAITNIGCKPTVAEEKKVVGAESYLYDFSEEIYDREIEVSLYEFKRPERQFASLDELKQQLKKDIEEGKK